MPSNTKYYIYDYKSNNCHHQRRFIAIEILKRTAKRVCLLATLLIGFTGLRAQTHITDVSGFDALNGSSAAFIIDNDIDVSTLTTIASFGGTLEAAINPATHMPYRLTGLTQPLFATLTGTVRNMVLEGVNISQSGQVGAVACVASGSARIYNVGILSGSVGSTGTSTATDATDCCGGLVGLLDGNSNATNNPRVVNCYSYADITGGNSVGGLVGYNNYGTNKNNLRSMVFGCLFYGDIDTNATTSRSPIYNGTSIVNKDANGLSNFNYFRAEASYVQPTGVNYNCALLAETRFLQRFEFFRQLLNGHREMSAWWVTGNVTDTALIMKWVMLPDSIGSDHPYPVLMKWGRYPSVVNYQPSTTVYDGTEANRNKGQQLGTLAVHIEIGNGAVFEKPEGATITTADTTLIITDKDPAHFNFNYAKVQLPYYNDVGTKNYSDNRVVVGWMITSITGGTTGSFSVPANDNTPADAPYYNYADRNCTNKDLYSVSGRIFNQGDYWDVPEGVTAITIKPYWAKAAFVADDYRDAVYNTGMSTKYNVGTVGGGQWFTDNTDHIFTFGSESLTLRVYSAISNAITALSINKNHTVYDYAVVFVGNYHQYNGISNSKDVPYTLMSIDLDKDNEPDYCYILRFDSRTFLHPMRVDFLSVPGFGMTQKSTGGTGSYNFGIPKPRGWFEVTNTGLFRVTQFEYSPNDRVKKPIILHGGVIEQWVSSQGAANSSGDAGDRTSYFYVGDNVWFKEFHIGVHQDYPNPTPHPPISVTGGDYDEFYLTGLYRADATKNDDNAECYINGGLFGIVAGAGMEGIGSTDGKGNITWQIDHADIEEFYGGGINAANPVIGNITTTISNSHVTLFCGGPKFGDMSSGKTVVTTATGCTFGTYFGAGYGGNSYSRRAPSNKSNVQNIEWNNWVKSEYKQDWNATHAGISTQINYQFIPMSGNASNVARLFVEYVKFSLATTHDVTSTLTGCTVTGNFYGGGSLGKVDGTVTSTLTDCTVLGNVYGSGFSASLPTVEVDSIGYRVEPLYYSDLGTYRTAVKGVTTTYTWEQRATVNSTATGIDKTNHILYTTEDLTTLGTVQGTVNLTIGGNSHVGGSVYGGGEQSKVAPGNIEVVITGNTEVAGDVFGGGQQGDVDGNTHVTIR